MIEIARRKAAAQHIDNVAFERATIEDADVADQSMDVVLGLSILHLVENRDSIIAKVYRMLKHSGVFGI